ncbi:LysE family translocator [Pseudoalteromonas piscicida]|uniref:LysE family translocator n=1 Tax=Pseudoalteromonas piscicida TaxID=43662 RepID=A0AAQ2ESS8_PSEO7|nr:MULTISPECIES: LysE family translocator [Pseudoalteromonas]KJY90750.1 amino acid transporter [Pseudoalteromonas piscicida]TMN35763.1 LysE family translocator [Pseudoalteromonas piscicida]TMN36013.1 LysE family translocator [Pseudoalteromonas piscicida]TMN48412.1 LysE family translocator [Pseudoalteromonas piscicida]TMN49206.1 LysE family translocator [Pseudoalteromonas piscicida]
MLNLEYLFSFLIASMVIAVAPGPSNAFLMAQTFTNGRAAGMQSALGFALGGVIHTLFAVVGLSALLKASETAYTTVQYLGAAYLAYLGVMTIKETLGKGQIACEEKPHVSTKKPKNVMFQAMMTEVLNPKVALFFIAFIPQFVDSSLTTSTTMQLAMFGLLYPILAFPIDCMYIYGGDKIAGYFRQHPTAPVWIDRISGLIFIALAVNLLL